MIELFCPSRGRPKEARELYESFFATKVTDAKLIFCVDQDDLLAEKYPGNLIFGPPTGDPTGPLNRCALASESDIVGFIGDDSRFETKGWDARVIEALQTPGFCWGDDSHDIPWPSTVFVSKVIVDALGWIALPTLHRGFFDVVWMHLAGAWRDDFGWRFPPGNCARILSDVMFRHDNSKSMVDPAVIAADERAYHEWFRTAYKADRRKVIAATDIARFFPTTV